MVNPFNSDWNDISSRKLDLENQLNIIESEKSEFESEQVSLFQEGKDIDSDISNIEAALAAENSALDGYKSKLDDNKSKVADLRTSLRQIEASRPSEGDFTKTIQDENGDSITVKDTAAYNEALKEWSEQKAKAENELAEAEKIQDEIVKAFNDTTKKIAELESKKFLTESNKIDVYRNANIMTEQIRNSESEIEKLKKEMEQIDAMQDVTQEEQPVIETIKFDEYEYILDENQQVTETIHHNYTEYVYHEEPIQLSEDDMPTEPSLPNEEKDSNAIKKNPSKPNRFDELN